MGNRCLWRGRKLCADGCAPLGRTKKASFVFSSPSSSSTPDPWGEKDHNLVDPTALSSASKLAMQCVNTTLNPDIFTTFAAVAAASATFCYGEGVLPDVQSHQKMMTQYEEEGANIVPPFL
eukprot:8321004-Ditylum_brightwellii.AAC.1